MAKGSLHTQSQDWLGTLPFLGIQDKSQCESLRRVYLSLGHTPSLIAFESWKRRGNADVTREGRP